MVTMTLLVPDGIQEESLLNDIQIWPNPSENIFHGKIVTSKATCLLYDSYGKLLMREHILDSGFDINLSGYANGIYLLHVTDGNSLKHTVKLIKK